MFALLALLCSGPALAGDGYWHPNDLMSESAAFKRLNEGMIGPFEERTRQSDEYARALNDYQLAIDLLGSRSRPEDQAHLDALTKQFNREQAVIEAFAGALIEDVDNTFYGAVERALGGFEGTIQTCEREIATGPQVPGMKRRTQANPECTGDNMNSPIAQALDADAALKKDIDEILSLEWPGFTLASSARPPVGDAGPWVSVAPLFKKGARDALRRIDMADETARLPFQAAIEDGADAKELEGLSKQAEAVTAATAAKRATLGETVLAAADKSIAKWDAPVAWCLTPAALGGCEGTSANKESLGKLLDDDRVEKAFKKASAAIDG